MDSAGRACTHLTGVPGPAQAQVHPERGTATNKGMGCGSDSKAGVRGGSPVHGISSSRPEAIEVPLVHGHQDGTQPETSTTDELCFKLAAEMGWARCPACGSLIERTEGCNSVCCRCGCVCHYEWNRVLKADGSTMRTGAAGGSGKTQDTASTEARVDRPVRNPAETNSEGAASGSGSGGLPNLPMPSVLQRWFLGRGGS